jgi:hypothetical protein
MKMTYDGAMLKLDPHEENRAAIARLLAEAEQAGGGDCSERTALTI